MAELTNTLSGQNVDLPGQIAKVKEELAKKNQQMINAKQAGYIPGTPTGKQQIPENVLNAPTQPNVPAGNASGFEFGNMMQTAIDRLNTISPLTNVRQQLIKHLFDTPLTPEEVQQLPQEYQQMVNTGDKKSIEMGVRLLNDNISGRMGTMDQSVQFLTNLYVNDQKALEDKKQQSIDNVLKIGEAYGDKAADVFDSIYGTGKLDELSKQYGMDFRTLLSTPTLAQTEAAKKSGTEGSDASTYVEEVLTGRQSITNVPTGNGLRAEVSRLLQQIYANPVAKRIEVWKARKEKFLSGQDKKDPGTRETLINQLMNDSGLKDYIIDPETGSPKEGILDIIASLVYQLVPDTWEDNIESRWKEIELGGIRVINPND